VNETSLLWTQVSRHRPDADGQHREHGEGSRNRRRSSVFRILALPLTELVLAQNRELAAQGYGAGDNVNLMCLYGPVEDQ